MLCLGLFNLLQSRAETIPVSHWGACSGCGSQKGDQSTAVSASHISPLGFTAASCAEERLSFSSSLCVCRVGVCRTSVWELGERSSSGKQKAVQCKSAVRGCISCLEAVVSTCCNTSLLCDTVAVWHFRFITSGFSLKKSQIWNQKNAFFPPSS